MVKTSSGIILSPSKKEILPHATTWMNLEDVTNAAGFQLREASKTVKLGPEHGGCQGLGVEGSGSHCPTGPKFQFHQVKKFQRCAV